MRCLDKNLRHEPLQGGHSHEPLLDAAHAGAHSHCHTHGAKDADKRMLRASIIITTIAMIIQFVYSIITNSLALLSDTLHMFSHVFALSLSFFAVWLSEKNGGEQRTFGFYRAEVIVAFINSVTTAVFVVFILYEAVQKLVNPQPIDAKTLIVIAVFGLAVNCITGFLLLKADMHNINIKSSFLHMMSDLLSSVGVVIGAIFLYFTGAVWIDAALALLIAFMIGKWSFSLIRQSIEILLESSPIPIEAIRELIAAQEGVLDVHDIHVSEITHNMYVLTAHIVISPHDLLKFQSLIATLSDELLRKFKIGHCTFQPEWRELWRVCDTKSAIFGGSAAVCFDR